MASCSHLDKHMEPRTISKTLSWEGLANTPLNYPQAFHPGKYLHT